MKNNTLHIVYNDSTVSAKCNMTKDAIKSYRCNKPERAKHIVQSTIAEVIDSVIWKDRNGKTHSAEEILSFEKEVKSNPPSSSGATRKRFLEKNIATIIEKKKIREKRNK